MLRRFVSLKYVDFGDSSKKMIIFRQNKEPTFKRKHLADKEIQGQ